MEIESVSPVSVRDMSGSSRMEKRAGTAKLTMSLQRQR